MAESPSMGRSPVPWGDSHMQPSLSWFVVMAVVSALMLRLGVWLGRGSRRRAGLAMVLGFSLLAWWLWLHKHPEVAVRVIPVSMLSQLEGIGAVPAFMLIVGIAWSMSRLPRQRKVTLAAALLGGVYFLHGGLWMLQTTPTASFGGNMQDGVVMQTQDYSCVAAACATALNDLGLTATEAQMAELTQTRPGTGATLIRALEGLENRLAGSGFQARLVEPTYQQLMATRPPVLTPLRFETTMLHMVVLRRVNEHGVLIADPTNGEIWFDRPEFEAHFTRQALVFEPRGK